MRCPLCGGKLSTFKTRPKSTTIQRERDCTECLTTFHTTEKINYEKLPPYLLKKLHERVRDNG